jgi:hypothetical protein
MGKKYLAEFDIDMHDVKEHYMHRKDVSKQLIKYLKEGTEREYVELAVGITDHLANYSAHEHQLDPRILDNNSISSVFNLAQRMSSKNLKVTHLPKTIYQANLPYLKISVGSEMASLLQPKRFWVGNVSSEMNYQIWRDIYFNGA